jgi:hypothetical protein
VGENNGNISSLENIFKAFMQTQTEQNNILIKIMENCDNINNKWCNQSINIEQDVHALQERTKAVETQLGKIVESQTLIVARFTGKPELDPVEELKMMRIAENKELEELDYSNASSLKYTTDDVVKMITLKNPGIEGGNESMYRKITNQVAMKVHELEISIKSYLRNYLLS